MLTKVMELAVTMQMTVWEREGGADTKENETIRYTWAQGS